MWRFKKILVHILKGYTLDLRALSLMRMGVALLVITDLIIRAGDLTAHYTNNGIWPVHLIHNFGWKFGYWSVHELNGSYGWALSLFVIHFVFAFFLLVGYKTRLANLMVWLLYISLHNRNLFVLQAGDDLLRLVLFWGLFLPWNAFYSVDSKNNGSVKSLGYLPNMGFLMLIASVYFFTVNLKESSEWREEGSAVYYALSLDQLRLPGMGDWLYAHPDLMKVLTHFFYGAEIILPLLILLPSRKGYLRLTAFILICILHLGIGLTLYVGLFFAINIVTALGLLPSFVFKRKAPVFSILYHTRVNKQLKPTREKSKAFVNLFMVIIIVMNVIINLSTVKWFNYNLRSEILIPFNTLRMDQMWGMFSPGVLKKDGWLVYHGMDSLGRQWDLRLNSDYVDYSKPEHVVSMYKTDRWRKLAENMQRNDMTFLRPQFGKYILRKWNSEHPEKKLATLNLYFMQKENLPDYKTTKIEKILYCVCNAN
ncbi:MAG: hypothetical protein JWO32_1747 [Bacteroidetes bacterium]|nr:hypothetical protein [Bacteroidota bacterium]